MDKNKKRIIISTTPKSAFKNGFEGSVHTKTYEYENDVIAKYVHTFSGHSMEKCFFFYSLEIK